MSDAVFFDQGKLPEAFDIEIVEPVASAYAKGEGGGGFNGHGNLSETLHCFFFCFCFGVVARVDFHNIRSARVGSPYLFRIGIHEKTDLNARIFEPFGNAQVEFRSALHV